MSATEDTDISADLLSLHTFMDYQWILLKSIGKVIPDKFGEKGIEVIAKGFRDYGYYRGQYLRDLPEVIVNGRNPLSLFKFWDTGEVMQAKINNSIKVNGMKNYVEITFQEAPGEKYFRNIPEKEILQTYWREFLSGLSDGFDESVKIEASEISFDTDSDWKMVFFIENYQGSVEPVIEPEVINDKTSLIKLSRRTIGAMGGLITSVGRVLQQTYDGAGDVAFSEIAYNFGAERGSALKEQHIKEGKPISFTSFFGGIQERDSDENVFVYRGERYISPGVFQMDCTYCPLAEVWHENGPDSLNIAYLFDMHNHRGLLESYHPETLVRWDSVKSRGDTTCKFRFVIPSLLSEEDPDWAQAFRNSNQLPPSSSDPNS